VTARSNSANSPPGSYGFLCFKPGYGPNSRPLHDVILGPGEIADDVEIELSPPGVISGRVLDAEGNPLPGIKVQAEQPRRLYRNARIERRGDAMTDDRGDYRIWGLPAGRYYVRAGEERPGTSLAYTPAYFPSAMDLEASGQVRLDWGSEAGGVDIRLAPAAPTVLRGVLRNSVTGEAVGRRMIRIVRRGSRFDRSVLTPTTRADGSFQVDGLPPGPYRLLAQDRESQLFARVDVQLVEDPAVTAILDLAPGVEVSGVARMERPSVQRLRDAPRSAYSRVQLTNRDVGALGGGEAELDSDGNFVIKYVAPGNHQIGTTCRLDGGYVVRASVGGRELPNLRVPVSSGVPTKELEIWCSSKTGKLRWTIRPAPDASPYDRLPQLRLWLRPIDDSPWNFINPYGVYGSGHPGAYPGLSVRPGRHMVYAISSLLEINWDDPQVVQALAPYGQTVEIKPGETAEVDLVFAPSSFRLP
jgi:hypothetical protein